MPYKDPQKRREYDKLRKRRLRAEAKEQEAQKQVSLGNLNFGLGTPRELDWKDWKESMEKRGKTPIFEEFLDAKGQTQKVEAEEFPDMDLIPEMSEDCTVYRKMRMGILRKNAFFIQGHILCPYCKEWFKIFNSEFKPIGVDLWS